MRIRKKGKVYDMHQKTVISHSGTTRLTNQSCFEILAHAIIYPGKKNENFKIPGQKKFWKDKSVLKENTTCYQMI